MVDQLTAWRALLAGEKPALSLDRPQCGFWRYRLGGVWRRVQITGPEGNLTAADNDDLADLELTWRRVLTNPTPAITYEAYKAHASTGDFPRDHNKPPELVSESGDDQRYKELTAEVDAILERVGKILAEREKADVDVAAALAKELTELAVVAEKEHADEKRPWLAGCRKIDDRWSFAKTLREAAVDIKRNVVTPILTARKAAADAEARRVAEEARKAQLAEFEASFPAPDAAPPPPPKVEPAAPVVSAGVGGKSVKLKTVEVATVTDGKAFAAYLLDQGNDDLSDFLAKAAAKLLRAGVRNADGVTITTEQVAK